MKLLMLIVLVAIGSLVEAQKVDYDLELFRQDEFAKQLLFLDLDLSGNTSSLDVVGDEPFEVNDFSGGVEIGYNNRVYKSKVVNSLLIEGIVNHNKYREKKDNFLDNSNLSFSAFVTVENDFKYYFKNSFFVKTDVQMAVGGLNNSAVYRGLATNNENRTDIVKKDARLAADFSVGFGRLFPVDMLQYAAFVLQDLIDNDRLSRSPTNTEISNFANVLVRVTSRRIFDLRVAKKLEIVAIDSFLRANNLVSNPDGFYYAGIADMAGFAPRHSRESGFAVSGGAYISGINEFSDSENQVFINGAFIGKSDSETKQVTSEFGSSVGVSYSKPINLNWQFDTQIFLRYGKFRVLTELHELTGNESITNNYNKGIVSGSSKMSFFPNTRTEMSLNLSSSFEKYANDAVENTVATSNVEIIVSYYFSSALRFIASASLKYSDFIDKDIQYEYKKLQSSMNLSLVYYLF